MSSLRRIRRSAAQWQELIHEQAASSGLSQAAFCKRERIALSSFSNWKRKLASRKTSRAVERQKDSPWIDLSALTGADSGWDIELDLGGGVCLRLRHADVFPRRPCPSLAVCPADRYAQAV